jgi:hypothetical protein
MSLLESRCVRYCLAREVIPVAHILSTDIVQIARQQRYIHVYAQVQVRRSS